jgi:16S rRNA (cytidine1402-2'-O)-methyltransferase
MSEDLETVSRQNGPGTLFVVATPIGNLEDITLRALRVLREADVFACEDTRTTGMLLKLLGVERGERRMVAYHDVNERRACQVLLDILKSGQNIALVSDAGTPLISDPGYRVVSLLREAGMPVVAVPGPCAAVAALGVSGLPTDRFTFFGFPPAKSGRRQRLISSLDGMRGTCVFYVPARQIPALLTDFQAFHPRWRLVVARELTKMFEEFIAGTAAEVQAAIAGRTLKGEVTLLAAAPIEGDDASGDDMTATQPQPEE